LASGSTGNATLVQSDQTSLLFDAGLSMRYILNCLKNLDINPNAINGIFLSHEHSDHIRGAGVLSRNTQIPLWSNLGTWEAAKNRLGKVSRNHIFITERSITIKDLEILPIPVSHEAAEPVCFRISQPETGLQVGIVTDIGILTPPVKYYLQNSNLLMLESNYDLDMLVHGTYPENVKLFIMGELGHLSNPEAGESLLELIGDRTEHVLLSHISKDNNTQTLARGTVAKIIKQNELDDSILQLTHHSKMSEIFSI
jgi:phosphoribosyl 1,2-cyclic phosphodiesterase